MVNKPTDNRLTRRGFLSAATATGAAALLGGAKLALGQDAAAGEAVAELTVPTRPFGKTGVDVPILSVGGTINTTDNQLMLRKSLDWGATYWDTAMGYSNGKSEQGMGKFFAAHPGSREKVFLVTKSGNKTPVGLTRDLDASLERLQTDHVDLYFLHGLNKADQLTDELVAWGAQAKEAGKIKLFGFSSHDNMSACMTRAAEMEGIDGIMLLYNFRVMVLDAATGGKLTTAIDACHKAGIGLTAMKTQGGRMEAGDEAAEAELLEAFLAKGFTPQQAALKAIWEDQRFACICSKMESVQQLQANVAAAVDKTELTAADRAAMTRFAEKTCGDYCAGCSEICSRAVAEQVPVHDVLRYLMYYNAYNDRHEARELFAQLPAAVRRKLTSVDYSQAEARCPQNIPIAARMKLANELLA